jgi:DHA3 family macrolide efflux protein-like MFS transporter
MKNWKNEIARFMISQTVSLLGSMVVMYAIMWYVTLSTQSGIMMTIYVLTTFIPSILISPFAGVWADRLNRKKLMIIADLSIAAVTLLISVLFFMGIRDIWIIFVVSIVRAFGQAVHQPAVSAVYPQIVPPEYLVKVQGIAQGIQSSSMIIMPLLAGLLLATIPLEYILLIDVVTAIIAVVLLIWFVRIPQHAAETSKQEINYFKDIKDGLSYTFNHKFVFRIMIFGFLFMLLVAAPMFLTYLQVARVFGPEAWRLATLEAVFGIGMLSGSLLISVWGGFKNRLITYFISYIALGLGTIVIGIPFNFFFYVSMWAVVGFFVAISSPLLVGLIQEKVNPEYIGRVFSVYGLINSISMPLGMLVFGPISDFYDISLIILLSGVGMVIIAIVPFFMKNLIKEGVRITPDK